MTDRWELAARLAALHDREIDDHGDAEDAESEALLQELAAADDDVLTAYADAVAIAREHREADAAAAIASDTVATEPVVAGPVASESAVAEPIAAEPAVAEPVVAGPAAGGAAVTPLRPRERTGGWRRPQARWLALAAALAALALIPLLRRASSSPADAGRFAALLDSRDTGLPPGWTEERPWGSTRGGGSVTVDTALAVRTGVVLLDLELAVRARDRETTARLAQQVNVALVAEPGTALVAGTYREIERLAGAPPAELEGLLKEGRETLGELLGPELVAVGSWSEAALLAAARRDAGFFESPETRKVLGGLSDDPSLDPSIRRTLDRVRAALPSGGDPDWAALPGALTEMIRVMGR